MRRRNEPKRQQLASRVDKSTRATRKSLAEKHRGGGQNVESMEGTHQEELSQTSEPESPTQAQAQSSAKGKGRAVTPMALRAPKTSDVLSGLRSGPVPRLLDMVARERVRANTSSARSPSVRNRGTLHATSRGAALGQHHGRRPSGGVIFDQQDDTGSARFEEPPFFQPPDSPDHASGPRTPRPARSPEVPPRNHPPIYNEGQLPRDVPTEPLQQILQAALEVHATQVRAAHREDISLELASLPIRIQEIVRASLQGYPTREEVVSIIQNFSVSILNDVAGGLRDCVAQHQRNLTNAVEQQAQRDQEANRNITQARDACLERFARFQDQVLPEQLHAALGAFKDEILSAIDPAMCHQMIKAISNDITKKRQDTEMTNTKLNAIRAEVLDVENRQTSATRVQTQETQNLLRALRTDVIDIHNSNVDTGIRIQTGSASMQENLNEMQQTVTEVQEFQKLVFRAMEKRCKDYPIINAICKTMRDAHDQDDSDEESGPRATSRDKGKQRYQSPEVDSSQVNPTSKSLLTQRDLESLLMLGHQDSNSMLDYAQTIETKATSLQAEIDSYAQENTRLQDDLCQLQEESRKESQEYRATRRKFADLEKQLIEVNAALTVIQRWKATYQRYINIDAANEDIAAGEGAKLVFFQQ
jgi:hypothetical protein